MNGAVYCLASLVEGFYPPWHCSVKQCRFPTSLLKTLMTLSCCTASGTFSLYSNGAVYCLASLVEGFYPPCHCSVRQCRFPASLLNTLMTLSCCTASGTSNLYPTPLFLFRKHRDNTTLDRQLTRGSVLLVTAHARDVGRESPFALR